MTATGFDEFYLEHFDTVARVITLAAGDRELGRDATQEAFARALRKWRHVKDMERPDGWVYVVAMNQLRDHWRRLGRRHPESQPLATDDNSSAVVTRLSVRDAIATLPARQRQAVVLRYLADLSVDDIAAAMSCAPGTVKATLHAALRSMRVELEENDDAE